MAAIGAPESRVAPVIERRSHDVSIAAVNGPHNTVVSGCRPAVEAVIEELEREGFAATRLRVSHAFHSPLMEPILGPFSEVVAKTALAPPRIPVISNLTGFAASDRIASAPYWVEHVREPVRFAAGMAALQQSGCDAFLEVGPQPHLIGMGRQVLGAGRHCWLPSLQRGVSDWRRMLDSIGELYARGAAIDWQAFDSRPRQRLELPTYAFQRQRYWIGSGVGIGDDRPAPTQPAASPEALCSLSWHAVAIGSQRREPGRLRVLPDRGSFGRSVAIHLRASGQDVVEDADTAATDILDFRALDLTLPDATSDATLGCAAVLHLVQDLARADMRRRVWLVTQGAMAIDADSTVVNPAQSALWGLARVMFLEHRELVGGIIDLPADLSPRDAAAVLRDVLHSGAGSQIAIRA